MQADKELHEKVSRPSSKLPIIIAVVALVAIATWVFVQKQDTPPALTSEAVKPAPPPPPKAVDEAPDIPQLMAEVAEDEQTEEESQLPPLTESDEFARNVLSGLNDSETFSLWLQTDNLLQKAVTFVDGVSRGNILKKVIPVQPPSSKFQVVREDDRIYLDPANYHRYDDLVNLVTGISPQASFQSFHTLRPLLEAAFGDLGYPGDKMDNSLIAAIDQVLSAPEIEEPIALKSESVAYTFADPKLEALPAVHKQMIRMGPENTRKVKQHLSQIRQSLLAEQATLN
jgi:Protein of unknown function (DUF3014)